VHCQPPRAAATHREHGGQHHEQARVLFVAGLQDEAVGQGGTPEQDAAELRTTHHGAGRLGQRRRHGWWRVAIGERVAGQLGPKPIERGGVVEHRVADLEHRQPNAHRVAGEVSGDGAGIALQHAPEARRRCQPLVPGGVHAHIGGQGLAGLHRTQPRDHPFGAVPGQLAQCRLEGARAGHGDRPAADPVLWRLPTAVAAGQIERDPKPAPLVGDEATKLDVGQQGAFVDRIEKGAHRSRRVCGPNRHVRLVDAAPARRGPRLRRPGRGRSDVGETGEAGDERDAGSERTGQQGEESVAERGSLRCLALSAPLLLLTALATAAAPVHAPEPGSTPAPEAAPEADPDADAEADADPEAVPEADPGAVPEADADPVPEAVPEADPDADPDANPDANPDADPDLEPDPEPDPEPTPDPDPDLDDPTTWAEDEEGDDEWGTEPDGDADFELPADGYDPMRDSPEAIANRHWIRAGAVLLATGGALAVGAVILGATDPCAPRAGNSCQTDARNRAALTIGLPGVAIVAGGAIALSIGMHRQSQLAASLSVARADGQTVGAGLTLRGRF